MPARRPSRTPGAATVALAAAVGAAAATLSVTGVLAPLDAALYDRMATRTPAPLTPPGAVIVAIDEPSFADLGLAWPWPREVHAALIASLRAAGARVVALDIVFAEPGDPASDAALAAAMGPDVVLAADLDVIATPQGILTAPIEPLPALVAAGARVGRVALPLDMDGAVRRLPTDERAFAAVALGESAHAPPPGALVDFAAPADHWPRVSYYQALDAAALLPPGLFDGRIAFVGFALQTAPEITASVERFRTPRTALGEGLAPGIELHARAADALARRDWIAPTPGWTPPVLALIAAAAAAALSSGRAAPAGAAIACALALAVAAIAAALLAAGFWLPPAAPALAAMAAGVGQSGLGHARERRARRMLRRAFEHYLSPAMVRRLAHDPTALRLGGERRRVTILFCDLRGFTTLSERMKDEPEALTALVNRALTVVADAVLAHDGMVDKFIGDCVMGLWNAPLDAPDHARRAIEAGVAAVEGVARLSRELAAEAAAAGRSAYPIACGVGVNTGDCVIGNLGSARRFDYTALGDPVNLAARLESMTKALGVALLVGEDAANEAGVDGLVELDTIVVKGRQAPVRVFTASALWPDASAAALEVQAAALEAARAGRSGEAAALWRRLASLSPSAAPYALEMLERCAAPSDRAPTEPELP